MIIRFSEKEIEEINAVLRPLEEEDEILKSRLMDLPEDAFILEDGVRVPASGEPLELTIKINENQMKMWEARADLYNRISDRRFKEINKSPKAVIRDAHEQTDFIISQFVTALKLISPKPSAEEYLRIQKEIKPLRWMWDSDTWKNITGSGGNVEKLDARQIINLIITDLRRHYSVLEPKDTEKLTRYIEQAVLEALESEQGNALSLLSTQYFPFYHDKYIDNFRLTSDRKIEKLSDGKNGEKLFIELNDGTIYQIKDIHDLADKLGIPVQKLLITGIALFYTNTSQYTVFIPTEKYFKSAGYKVDNPLTLSKYVDRTNEYIRTLRHITIADDPKKDGGDWLVAGGKATTDWIRITFNPFRMDQLKQSAPITQFPLALLGLSAKNPNAYHIGYKMVIHSFNIKNIDKGSNSNLRVVTLLSASELPFIDDIRKQRGSWKRKIKIPFENALNALIKEGVISKWSYCKAKGTKMTAKEEEKAFSSYEAWSNCYIHFEMKDAPDLTREVEEYRIQKQKEEDEEPKKQRRKSSGNRKKKQ